MRSDFTMNELPILPRFRFFGLTVVSLCLGGLLGFMGQGAIGDVYGQSEGLTPLKFSEEPLAGLGVDSEKPKNQNERFPASSYDVEMKLLTPVSLDFDTAGSFGDALEWIQNTYDILFYVDHRSLIDNAIEYEALQSSPLVCKDLPLHAVLNLLVKEHDLDYSIYHNMVVICDSDSVYDRYAITRVYTVSDLEELGVNGDSLVRMIQEKIVPHSWYNGLDTDGEGTLILYGTGEQNNLMATTSFEAHCKIEALLHSIRRAGGHE